MKKEPIRDYLRNEIRCPNCNQVLSCIENDEGGLEANAFVEKHHRYHGPVVGHKYSIPEPYKEEADADA